MKTEEEKKLLLWLIGIADAAAIHDIARFAQGRVANQPPKEKEEAAR